MNDEEHSYLNIKSWSIPGKIFVETLMSDLLSCPGLQAGGAEPPPCTGLQPEISQSFIFPAKAGQVAKGNRDPRSEDRGN